MAHEKALKKIATKGVVRLFNAVKDFQNTEHKETAEDKMLKKKVLTKNIRATFQKTDKVSKNAFMDILKKGASSRPISEFTA